jgi:hypothetical protein
MTLFATAGACLICIGLVLFLRANATRARSRMTDGKITRYKEDSDGDVSFTVVTFHDDAGNAHETYGPSGSPLPPLGTVVRVHYDMSDPSRAWTAASITLWVLPTLFVIAGLATLLAGVVLAR